MYDPREAKWAQASPGDRSRFPTSTPFYYDCSSSSSPRGSGGDHLPAMGEITTCFSAVTPTPPAAWARGPPISRTVVIPSTNPPAIVLFFSTWEEGGSAHYSGPGVSFVISVRFQILIVQFIAHESSGPFHSPSLSAGGCPDQRDAVGPWPGTLRPRVAPRISSGSALPPQGTHPSDQPRGREATQPRRGAFGSDFVGVSLAGVASRRGGRILIYVFFCFAVF